MSVSVRLGDCEKYLKERSEKYPNWHCYEDFKVVDSSSLTKELFEEYPFEYFSKKTKLFFDYDEKSEDLVYIKKKRNEIRDKLIQYHHDYTNGFVFTESISNPNKISFHVIFKKNCIIRSNFIKEDEQELFNKLVGEENFQHIDHQVYGNKTCFRLPYGTKGKELHSSKEYPHIPFIGNGEKLVLSDYILSVPDDTETKFYTTQLARALKKQLEEDERNYKENEEEDPSERESKLVKALELVKRERFQQYNQWLALMVVIKTHRLNRDLFIKMSEESGYAYFDEMSCIKHWRQCTENKKFGMHTVIGWLKQDGVDVKKLFPTKSPILTELLSGWNRQGAFTDSNVANTLYNHYSDNLIYTSQGWFHYTNKGWILGDKNSIFAPIMKLLSTDLLEYIDKECQKAIDRITKKGEDSQDEKEKAKAKMRLTLMKHVNGLQSASKIKSVLEVAEGIFRNDNVLSTFDSKPHWFCFDNQKAYDLKTKTVIDIKATDRILTTCGYDLPERNENNIKKVKDLIDTIIPKTNYKSFVSSLSSFLYGQNMNEKFIVFKGEGRNGKGLIISNLEQTMGNYYYALPTDVLTEHSKGAGRANPELAQTRWARCVMASEPDESKKIVKTTLNLLTGRDTITVRQLHKEPFQFMPSFTLGMMCNDVPNVSGGINDAIKQRIEFQNFPYTFVHHPKPDSNQRQINEDLKNIIRDDVSYRNGLFYLLSDAWFENQGRYISCEDSKDESEDYAKQNNPIMAFLDTYEESDTFERIDTFYKEYSRLYETHLTAQKFKTFMEQAKVKIEEDKKKGHKVFLKKIHQTLSL
jgi:phage/plasmid-associated DNA primase